MAEYFSPGVYVEEYDNAPRSVEGVGTSTGGFVGLAEKGPTKGAPLLVTNFKSFTKQFGGFLSEYTHGDYRYLANAVEQFFLNGGTRCYVSRVAPDDAVSASKKMSYIISVRNMASKLLLIFLSNYLRDTVMDGERRSSDIVYAVRRLFQKKKLSTQRVYN